MNNRKGVSDVVATVLIIMITIAAIGIVWTAIVPMIKDSLNQGSACFDAQSDVAIVANNGLNCVNKTSNTVFAVISKGANDKVILDSVTVIVTLASGSTQSFKINGTNVPTNNNQVVVNNTNALYANAIGVKVAPTVKIGNTVKTCDVATTEVALPECK